jgi:phospholipase/carboxylesterase
VAARLSGDPEEAGSLNANGVSAGASLSSTESGPLGFIHRFVPPRKGSQLTLLLLHGTGGNENDLLGLGSQLLPGAALLSPRGKVLENGAPRFFRRLAEGVFDINDLVNRTEELARFVEKASAKYGLGGKIIAVGYSNGANIAASLLLLRPGLLTGAVLFRPMVPFTMQNVPDLSGTQVLIEAGTGDIMVPREQPEALADLFRRGKADVTLLWQEAGHQLTEADIEGARQWFSRFPGSLSR